MKLFRYVPFPITQIVSNPYWEKLSNVLIKLDLFSESGELNLEEKYEMHKKLLGYFPKAIEV